MPKAAPGPVIWYPTSTISYSAGYFATSSPNTPASMHTYVDEVTADDADYFQCSPFGGGRETILGLTGAAIGTIDYAVLKIRMLVAGSAPLTVSVYPKLGSVTYTTIDVTGTTYADYSVTIPNADAISLNLSDLRLSLIFLASSGKQAQVSQITLTIFQK